MAASEGDHERSISTILQKKGDTLFKVRDPQKPYPVGRCIPT